MVSVIVPVFNEEQYIGECIESMLLQNYPKEKMEWFFVDGESTDKTVEILKQYQNKYPDLIKILKNKKRIQASAMNIGINEAIGEYIIRLDAHVKYPTDYISNCVYYLDSIECDNVGGTIITTAKSKNGLIISKILSSKFGVGNSAFRTNGSGYVDTVPFGAFKSYVFKKYGLFNELLARNEDNEINYRIRKNGGKIYLAEKIHSTYYCRETITGLLKQAFLNGKWNVLASSLCPGTMRLRHFVPLMFVTSLLLFLVLGVFFWHSLIVMAFELFLYFVLDVYFSFKCSKKISEFFRLLLLFFVFHITYGIGSFLGIFLSIKFMHNKRINYSKS